MESIYHHTSFKVLKSIVTNTGLNFRASKYSNYTNGEYEWIKDKANAAIQNMCEELDEPFDGDPMAFSPYIICFCGENLSRKMWLNYADSGKGIQIGVNADIVLGCSLKDRDPDVFARCVYMAEEECEDEERVKAAIECVYDECEFESDNYQDDLSVCASCLKQEEYKYEKEYRYMIPNYDIISFEMDAKGAVSEQEKENPENIKADGTRKYIYRTFPKAALASVALGHLTTDEQMEEVRRYLDYCGYDIGRIRIKRLEEKELY